MRVGFHDLFKEAPADAGFAENRTKEALVREADFVTLQVDLNATTRHFISDGQLSLMKPSAYLINTSRGPVVDQATLVRALGSGTIAGAALDVLEEEPPDPNDPILQLDNAFVLPHAGTGTVETRQAMIDLAADNLLAALAGKVPDWVEAGHLNTGDRLPVSSTAEQCTGGRAGSGHPFPAPQPGPGLRPRTRGTVVRAGDIPLPLHRNVADTGSQLSGASSEPCPGPTSTQLRKSAIFRPGHADSEVESGEARRRADSYAPNFL
jgi:hypothetical protein